MDKAPATGGTAPAHWHGRDFSGLCLGEAGPTTTEAFVETGAGVGVRTPDHLYYLPFAGPDHRLAEQPTQVYDLASDPYQFINLATQTAAAEVKAGLDARLRAWDASIPWPTAAVAAKS